MLRAGNSVSPRLRTTAPRSYKHAEIATDTSIPSVRIVTGHSWNWKPCYFRTKYFFTLFFIFSPPPFSGQSIVDDRNPRGHKESICTYLPTNNRKVYAALFKHFFQIKKRNYDIPASCGSLVHLWSFYDLGNNTASSSNTIRSTGSRPPQQYRYIYVPVIIVIIIIFYSTVVSRL